MHITWIVGGIAIIACTTWAVIPLSKSNYDSFTIDLHKPPKQESTQAKQTIDYDVFSAKLWNPQPTKLTETKVTKTKSQRTKPLKLQLIGITNDGNTLRAAIYDPDSDQLLIVSNGDAILGHTISEITKDTVAIAEGNYTHYLQLLGDKGIKGDAGL